MTDYIVMTKEQADAVAGPSTLPEYDYAELAPTVLADGVRYVLSPRVLTDPAHADKLGLLKTYDVLPVADDEFRPLPAQPH